MNRDIHLLPVPGQTSSTTVDESISMDNTLFGSDKLYTRNKPENLEWLKNAGFGLFLHWSLDVQLGCVISHSLVGASKDYTERFFTELPKTLNPRHWDFEHLARLSHLIGIQYAVFTTKHHNGFCLWDTKTTDFNLINTPYGKDLVRQYVEAFGRQGIKTGFYFSPEDFWYLRNVGESITRTPEKPYHPTVMRGYEAYLTAQMTELLTEYGLIDILFFDGGESIINEENQSLQQLCMKTAWDIQPNILITRGAIPTPEQQLPGVGSSEAWEGCMTLGTAWQYQPTNEQYKTGKHVIRLLVETRAKGGSLLINIAPDADGVLCREQENILREIGLWRFINHEVIHNVRPWILTNEDSIWLLRAKDDSAVFAVLFDQNDWDRGIRKSFVLKSVRATANTSVEVLGQSGELTEYCPDLDAHTYWEQKEDGFYISAMNAQRIYCGLHWRNPLVLKITHAEPAFTPMEVLTCHEKLRQSAGEVLLVADVRSLGSFKEAEIFFDYRVYPGFALSSYDEGWQSTDKTKVTATGLYTCTLPTFQSDITYQYRAVIANALNCMRGEMHLF